MDAQVKAALGVGTLRRCSTKRDVWQTRRRWEGRGREVRRSGGQEQAQQRTTGPRSPRESRSTKSSRTCSTHWVSRRAGATGWDLWILLRDNAEDLNLETEKQRDPQHGHGVVHGLQQAVLPPVGDEDERSSVACEHPLRDPRETSHQLHEQRVHRDRRDHRAQSHDDETRLSETGDPQLEILGDRGNRWRIIPHLISGSVCVT
ncbi:hypothetical protein EYF80_045138 [Liparis tanakae]|uniref:Uncharacterized protein n=1 Tax=Liparis tanakae TaxID=230148 RepID=A0A4Z2FWD5_9TELE|nr:hypothetical protein EYF80_045138 [Liparis tanakae]